MPVVYDLLCENGHKEESTFPNFDTYQRLKANGLLMCGRCNAPAEKLMPAPAIVGLRGKSQNGAKRGSEEFDEAFIRSNFEHVGGKFTNTARGIADGSQPVRPIWGHATLEEARELADEGHPIIEVPFMKLES